MPTRDLNSLQKHITREILVLSTKYLNEFENNVSRAIIMANETILNNLLDNANDKIRIDRVFNNVDKIAPTHDNVLQNLSRMLGDSSALSSLSSDFLDLYFDKKQESLSALIAKETFIKQDSAKAIIKMSSVLILCYLAKYKVTSDNLVSHFEINEEIKNIEPIATELVEKDEVKPTKKSSKKPDDNEKKSVEESSEQKPKSNKLFLITLFLVIAGIGTWFALNYSNESVSEPITAPNTVVVTDTETQPQLIEGENVMNLGDFIDFTLPSDEIITVPENGVEKALLDLVLDNSKSLDDSSFWLCMDRIHFDAREPNYKVDSEEQLKNLSLILASFPKVELNIGCYTDNLGKPENNLELSKKRSESIKSGLVKLGVSEKRLTTEGFGEGFPIAENTTPENQKMNRRISIKILKK